MFLYTPEDLVQQDDQLQFSLLDTLISIGFLKYMGFLKPNIASHDKANGLIFLTGGIVASTVIKSTGKHVVDIFNFSSTTKNGISDVLEFTADTLLLPVVSNLFIPTAGVLGYAFYMGLTLDVIPHYTNAFTDMLSAEIQKYYYTNENHTNEIIIQQKFPIINFDLFLPGFFRGITFATLYNFTGQKSVAAFIGGAIRGYMLLMQNEGGDTLYGTFMYAINASANQWEIFQFSNVFDQIIDGTTTTVTVEYITYSVMKLWEDSPHTDDQKELHMENKVYSD